MKQICYPDNFSTDGRRASFFLAVEEVVARRYAAVSDDDYFFLWQVPPTVVGGRNLWLDVEMDLDYCRSHGIDVIRRRSGGGAIYADMNNVMFGYITGGDEVVTTFARFTAMEAELLRSLGLDASSTTRNDVLISGRKVSGCAFLHVPGANIAHGTMLYDTDAATMRAALTPSRAKLLSKGVTSVESRVTTICRELPGLSLEEFKRLTIERLTDGKLVLTDDDMADVLATQKRYHEPQWEAPRRGRHAGAPSTRKRIEGVGQFDIAVATGADGLITGVTLGGDFFTTGPLQPVLDSLCGLPRTREAIAAALPDPAPVAGLTREALAELIADNS